MTHTGEQLLKLGEEYFKKFQRTYDDEQTSLQYYSQALEKNDLDSVKRADCYVRSGDIYRDRPAKSKENYDIALNLYIKATEVPGLPSWMNPQSDAERLALCPDLYGFRPEWRNEQMAANMHMQNLTRQQGVDLAITATDWFGKLLESSTIVNTKYTEVGFDYLDHSVNSCWDDLWKSTVLTCYGRAYKYHSDKTPEAFAKAVSWFKKSIQLNVDANESNQPWTIIGKGTARAYFELAELLSDPTRFGFEDSLKDEKGAKKTHADGIAHINKYKTLGAYSILESMYVDVWKKSLCFGRTNADLAIIKELCQSARKISKDRNAALYLFEAVAHHVICDKSVESYKTIVEAYYNCFKAKLETQDSHWIAEEGMKCVVPLVLDCVSEDFPKEAQSLECVTKMKDLLKEISEAPANKYFNQKSKDIYSFYSKVLTVQIAHADAILRDRMREVMNFAVKSHKDAQEAQQAEQEIQKLEKVQLKLHHIHNDEQLYGYYEGLLSVLGQSFTSAQVICNGQVQLDASVGNVAKIGLKLVSYIPIFGDKISGPLGDLLEFAKGAQMVTHANNICRLSASQTEFCALVQDAVIEVINLKQHEIINYKEDSPAQKKWYEKINAFVEKIKLKIDQTLYGTGNKSLTQMLGNRHANEITANHIANGKIYGGKSFLLPAKAKEEMIKVMTEVWVEKEEVKDAKSPDAKTPGTNPSSPLVQDGNPKSETSGKKKGFFQKLFCMKS